MSTHPPSLTKHISRTYKSALYFVVIVALFLPSFSSGLLLMLWYAILIALAIGTLGTCNHFRFQRFHGSLRPYVVGRMLQGIATVLFIGIVLEGISHSVITQAWVPHGVFWILVGAMVSRYYRIFRLADDAKHQTPDRCEFC